MSENPFKAAREARSVTLTFRMTPTEHAAVKAIADREKIDVVDLVREGLALVIDSRNKAAGGAAGRGRSRPASS